MIKIDLIRSVKRQTKNYNLMILETEYAETYYSQILEVHKNNKNSASLSKSVLELRLIFESLLKHLTNGEIQTFSNSFARCSFIIDKYQFPKKVSDDLNGFRKLANKAIHEENFDFDISKYFTCIRALSEVIFFLSELQIPIELAEVYQNKGSLDFYIAPNRNIELIKDAKCVVKEIGELRQNEKGVKFFQVLCEDEEELGKFTLSLWQSDRNDLSELHDLFWQYCSIRILNFKKVENKDDFYTSKGDTQVIIEPDFLIDASEIAECFSMGWHNPNLFILSKLISINDNIAAFKGKLINDLLDSLIREPEKPREEVIQNAITSNALKSAKFGQLKIDEALKSIKESHYNKLINIAKQYKNQNIKIEPTFFSSQYGLQGRLDALIEYQSDSRRKDIFELKSGKAPYGDKVWINNEMQVVSYNMLLKSTFGDNRVGNSAIFYSAADENNLRNVPSTQLAENSVLNVRNNIVSKLKKLSETDFSPLEVINVPLFGSYPSFKEVELDSFDSSYNESSPIVKKYYQHSLSYIIREHQTAKIGSISDEQREDSGFSALWLESLEEKEKKFNILYGLYLKEFDPYSNEVTFYVTKEINHNFREGDLGILYNKQGTSLMPLKKQILKGSISYFSKDELKFSLRNKQIEHTFFDENAEWVIEHDLYESNYWATTQSLYGFLQAPEKVKNLLLGIDKPENKEFGNISYDGLIHNQKVLLEKALNAKDYFLLQGPPGTGKTSTMMVAITRNLVNNTNQNIIVLAFTNRAVDEICNNLRDKSIPFIRLGSKNSTEDEALVSGAVVTVDSIVQRIKKYRVFVSTVASFNMRINDLKEIINLDILVLDEASQLTEPQVVGLIPSFNKFILIGDQNQLPAVSIQDEKYSKINDEDLISLGITNLSQSIFERLIKQCQKNNWDHSYGMLENHYRMHDDISNLINHYYSNKLQSSLERQRKSFVLFDINSTNPIEKVLAENRTVFFQSSRIATTKTNIEEAKRVAILLNLIKEKSGKNFNSKTVGVVTPWRAQIALIKSQINDDEIIEKVTIDTIERFQGSEKEIIIASLSVYHSNQLKALQSINLEQNVDRKLLVTISRAKEQLIVLGYSSALQPSQFYRDLIERIKRRNGFIDNRTSIEIFKEK